jgi:hypothetical protein
LKRPFNEIDFLQLKRSQQFPFFELSFKEIYFLKLKRSQQFPFCWVILQRNSFVQLKRSQQFRFLKRSFKEIHFLKLKRSQQFLFFGAILQINLFSQTKTVTTDPVFWICPSQNSFSQTKTVTTVPVLGNYPSTKFIFSNQNGHNSSRFGKRSFNEIHFLQLKRSQQFPLFETILQRHSFSPTETVTTVPVFWSYPSNKFIFSN